MQLRMVDLHNQAYGFPLSLRLILDHVHVYYVREYVFYHPTIKSKSTCPG